MILGGIQHNENLKKQFFEIQISFAYQITNFLSLGHHYVRQIFQKKYAYSKFSNF